MCPCVSLSCVETVLWFWNAPPLPRGLRLLGAQTGTFLCQQHRKEAAGWLEAGEFPVRSWGREGLYTLSWKLEPHRRAEWCFLTGFPQTRGSSSGVETCIIVLPTFLWHRRSASTLWLLWDSRTLRDLQFPKGKKKKKAWWTSQKSSSLEIRSL